MAAVIAGGFAADWLGALAMPAALAIALLASRLPVESEEQSGAVWTDNSDGTRSVSFTDLQQLRSVMPASYFTPVPAGPERSEGPIADDSKDV